MATTTGHRLIQQLLVSHPGGWVVGVTEDEQLQLIPELRADSVEIRQPVLLLRQRQAADRGPCQHKPTAMGWIRGIEEERRVPRVKNGKREMGCSLLGADQQLNLTLGVDLHAESALTPGCHCLLERCCPRLKAIRRARGVSDRRRHAAENLFRGL